MELQTRTRMGEKGRIVIPAEMRKALGMDAGGTLDLRVEDGELRISTLRARIRRVQERARKIIPPGVSLSEELSAERREAAKHE
jgi:antitoxin PrlF